jgi:hypothetical protein
MGRRKKAAKKIVKKKKYVVATVFKCIFCNHNEAVSCRLNHNTMVGELNCRVCDAHFEMRIHSLSDPIDVFGEWLDQTQEKQDAVARSGRPIMTRPLPVASSLGVRKRNDDEDLDDDDEANDKGHHDFVPNDRDGDGDGDGDGDDNGDGAENNDGDKGDNDDDDDDDDDDDTRRKKKTKVPTIPAAEGGDDDGDSLWN